MAGSVAGFGATRPVGSGPGAVSMLCDLFVHPEVHGSGCGRAMLTALWPGTGGRRMTFSSLHAHALPLYTSFGLDAWWPLLYLRGRVDALAAPAGWQAAAASPASVAAAELSWTGVDRSADHQAWARRPGGAGVLAVHDGEVMAAGTVGGAGDEFGVTHLAVRPAADDRCAATGRCSPPAGGPGSSTCSWRPNQACSIRAGPCHPRRWPERSLTRRGRCRVSRRKPPAAGGWVAVLYRLFGEHVTRETSWNT